MNAKVVGVIVEYIVGKLQLDHDIDFDGVKEAHINNGMLYLTMDNHVIHCFSIE